MVTISYLNHFQYQLSQGLELESFFTLFVVAYRKLRFVFYEGCTLFLEWGLFYIGCDGTTDVECECSTLVLRVKPMQNGECFYIGYQSTDVELRGFLHQLSVNRCRMWLFLLLFLQNLYTQVKFQLSNQLMNKCKKLHCYTNYNLHIFLYSYHAILITIYTIQI